MALAFSVITGARQQGVPQPAGDHPGEEPRDEDVREEDLEVNVQEREERSEYRVRLREQNREDEEYGYGDQQRPAEPPDAPGVGRPECGVQLRVAHQQGDDAGCDIEPGSERGSNQVADAREGEARHGDGTDAHGEQHECRAR